jgi:hypothetical protein
MWNPVQRCALVQEADELFSQPTDNGTERTQAADLAEADSLRPNCNSGSISENEQPDSSYCGHACPSPGCPSVVDDRESDAIQRDVDIPNGQQSDSQRYATGNHGCAASAPNGLPPEGEDLGERSVKSALKRQKEPSGVFDFTFVETYVASLHCCANLSTGSSIF